MLIPTSNYLIASGGKADATINSIKIDFSRISFVSKATQPHTVCQHCEALLIDEDRDNPLVTTPQGIRWFCRFCKNENVSASLHFASNNYKIASPVKLKSKIVPPIILFVIDNSGSMSQSIFAGLRHCSNPQVISEAKRGLSMRFNEILAQSKLYQQEKKEITKIEKNYTTLLKSTKYSEQEISKLTFLYAVIQYNLKQRPLRSHSHDARVAFLFFSDTLHILKAAKQKEIPLYVQTGELCHEEWPYRKFPVDFDDYDALFQQGSTYDKYFGDSRLSTLDLSKVAISKVRGGGRTALGPALALAMGIVSVHDQGSRVVLVTDSQPNFGLLAGGDIEGTYQRMGECLSENGATLSILKWSGQEIKENRNKEEQAFSDFRMRFSEHVDQIELNLNQCKQSQGLQMSVRSLNNLINREPLGRSYTLKVHCDNPKVKVGKLDQDITDFRTLRFLNNSSKCWFSLTVDRPSLQSYDYLFPVTTQLVLSYDDIFTKERCVFMAYTRQHLQRETAIKQNENEKQSFQECLDQQENINLHNLNELCHMETLCRYQMLRREEDYDPQGTVKTVFRYKQIEVERDIHSINDIAVLKNELMEDQEDYETL